MDANQSTQSKCVEQVYRDNFARVRSFLRVYLGNSSVVDDVAQDTFLQFWRRPDGFDPSGSTLKTYLLGIARKRAADWWRHQRPAGEFRPRSSEPRRGWCDVASEGRDAATDPDLRNVLAQRSGRLLVRGTVTSVGHPVGHREVKTLHGPRRIELIWRACE